MVPQCPLLYSSGDSLASASVFVIDKSGSVVWKDIGANYRHQVPARRIVEQLEKL